MERSWTYRYAKSVSWCLAQFGVGTHEYTPSNTAEVGYGIIVCIYGLIYMSYLTSSVTMAMIDFKELWSRQKNREKQVQQFCHERHISTSLQVTLLAYVRD